MKRPTDKDGLYKSLRESILATNSLDYKYKNRLSDKAWAALETLLIDRLRQRDTTKKVADKEFGT